MAATSTAGTLSANQLARAAVEQLERPPPPKRPRRCSLKSVEAVVQKHFLPIGLAVALLLGLTLPAPGAALAQLKVAGRGAVSFVCVTFIFIVSGLTLKTDDIKKALRAWKATAFGFVSILFLTPLLALLPQQLPFLPAEFQIGFLIFCTMPTTVNSGVALAQTAKGNFALALLLTVCTNLLGVVTVPFYLSLLLGVGGFHLDPLPLLVNLVLMILLPLALGKAAREASPRVQAFVKAVCRPEGRTTEWERQQRI